MNDRFKDYGGRDDDSILTKKLYKMLNEAAIDLGFGNEDDKTISEIGTERFAALLLDVSKQANRVLEKSHAVGLGYDATHFIARRLNELAFREEKDEA
jgi:hypothetical protein